MGYFVWNKEVFATPESVNRAYLVENKFYECDHSKPRSTDDLYGRINCGSGSPIVFRSQPNTGAIVVGKMSFGMISNYQLFADSDQYNAFCKWSDTNDVEASIKQNYQALSRCKVYETELEARESLGLH